MNKKVIISISIVIFLFFVAGVVFYIDQSRNRTNVPKPTISQSPTVSLSQQAPLREVVAENLAVPWDITFLPDGDILFTERSGNVKRLFLSSDLRIETIGTIENVREISESGLHGIALHPEFSNNHYVYLYYTYGSGAGNTQNRVSRFIYQNGRLSNETIIIDNIPGAPNHDGGRIRFGPDNYLYITTGDAQEPSLAQDTNSLAGKILRVTDEGEPAPENPFGNMTYSYGHRNPQGITWDETGNLWETEHGPSGLGTNCCRDEINIIQPGQNYGWPEITGDETELGMISPLLQSGPNTIWAPAGTVYKNGSLFFAGLRGEALYEARLNGTDVEEIIPHFKDELGRIRAVTLGPDGLLYVSTSNRDGRGNPKTGDDKIIRINPNKL